MKFVSRLRDRYVRFVEKQGFPIIVTVCVAVITATAVWTGQQEEPWVAPTPPPSGDVSAAQLIQQSLRQAATATPVPSPTPRVWMAPVQGAVLQPFSADVMVQSGITGVWQIHDAADLACGAGAKILAMSGGQVTAHGKDQLLGTWIRIDHSDGVEAMYAGMAMLGSFLTGDRVEEGDVIGYGGNGLTTERNLPAHLHLRVTRDGCAIDPVSLWHCN